MYQFYNAHPKGLRVGDCVKRAITRSTGMDYMEVQRQLNRHKKVTGAKEFNSDRNPEHYVETVLNAKRMSFPAVKGQPRMNGERFCKAYPSGSYILQMAGHWSCCVDGVIYDTWDCSEKCVYKAWEVKSCKEVRKVVMRDCNATTTHRVEFTSTDELIKVLRSDFERYIEKLKANQKATFSVEI